MPTTDPRRARGALGERLAAGHLVEQGYEVLERNFRTRHGELDLVLADDTCIVFCEVKTRVGSGSSGPARGIDAIGHAKRRRLRAMAGQWLRDRPVGSGRPRRDRLRFDAIGVTLSPGGALLSLEHVPDAF
jgi:putative endonuclease